MTGEAKKRAKLNHGTYSVVEKEREGTGSSSVLLALL